MINVPIALDYDALDRLFANFGKPVDGIYEGPAIQNVSTVLVADSNALTGDQLDGYQISDPDSIDNYGQQAGTALVTLVANAVEAESLAFYLQRPIPTYWFSDIEVPFVRLSNVQRTAVAQLEIGDRITVSKRFPNVTNPVVEELFVEGLEHRITPSGHSVTIYTSPAYVYTDFILDTSALNEQIYGLG